MEIAEIIIVYAIETFVSTSQFDDFQSICLLSNAKSLYPNLSINNQEIKLEYKISINSIIPIIFKLLLYGSSNI